MTFKDSGETMPEQNIPKTRGHVGQVIDSGIEGRKSEIKTIRTK